MHTETTTPATAPLHLTFDVVEYRSSTDGSFLQQDDELESGPICTGFCCCCCCCGVDSSVESAA